MTRKEIERRINYWKTNQLAMLNVGNTRGAAVAERTVKELEAHLKALKAQ